jgi:hypothetical protein
MRVRFNDRGWVRDRAKGSVKARDSTRSRASARISVKVRAKVLG